MNITPSDVTTILVAVAALVTAVGTAAASVLSSLRTDRKVDTVIAETKVIAGHVNSAATASLAKIEAMQSQIADLTRLLSESKTTAALLAQTAAIKESGG